MEDLTKKFRRFTQAKRISGVRIVWYDDESGHVANLSGDTYFSFNSTPELIEILDAASTPKFRVLSDKLVCDWDGTILTPENAIPFSIQKWEDCEELVDRYYPFSGGGTLTCALCQVYMADPLWSRRCRDACPIVKKGFRNCKGTPQEKFEHADTPGEARQYARDEQAFLKSLMPKIVTKADMLEKVLGCLFGSKITSIFYDCTEMPLKEYIQRGRDLGIDDGELQWTVWKMDFSTYTVVHKMIRDNYTNNDTSSVRYALFVDYYLR